MMRQKRYLAGRRRNFVYSNAKKIKEAAGFASKTSPLKLLGGGAGRKKSLRASRAKFPLSNSRKFKVNLDHHYHANVKPYSKL